MNRRNFLTLYGSVLLAGCTANGSSQEGDSMDTEYPLEVSVTDGKTVSSSEFGVSVETEVLRSRIDTDQTARLRISLTNQTDLPEAPP
ncbi:MAG: hypothetical protein SV253_07485 [Halobacteria archaeon]|nr:hypothetical protein [Halobacteria archaeon]